MTPPAGPGVSCAPVGRLEEFRRSGRDLAAISYDSHEILADFGRRQKICHNPVSLPLSWKVALTPNVPGAPQPWTR